MIEVNHFMTFMRWFLDKSTVCTGYLQEHHYEITVEWYMINAYTQSESCNFFFISFAIENAIVSFCL